MKTESLMERALYSDFYTYNFGIFIWTTVVFEIQRSYHENNILTYAINSSSSFFRSAKPFTASILSLTVGFALSSAYLPAILATLTTLKDVFISGRGFDI